MHWFDSVTKDLASNGLSRRSLMRLLSIGVGATAAPNLALAQYHSRDGRGRPYPQRLPQRTPSCPRGEVLRDGHCLPVQPKCSPGQVLRDGRCVSGQISCPPGQVLRDGHCWPAGGGCPHGEELRDGHCVPIQIGCPPGHELREGRCMPTQIACPPGQELRDGRCVLTHIVCPPGQELRDGRCVSTQIVCQPGQELRDGRCVPTQIVCRPGQELRDGRCVPSVPTTGNSTCNFLHDRDGDTYRLVTQTSFQNRPLTLERTVVIARTRPRPEIVFATIMKHGTDVLLESRVRYSPGGAPAYQGNVRVGTTFKGPKLAEFSSKDGKVINAVVQGRRLAPFNVATSSSGLRYANGEELTAQPTPPDLAAALQDLWNRAATANSACTPPPERRHPRPVARHPAGTDNPNDSAGCLYCIGLCAGAAGVGIAATCIFTFGIGCAVAVGAGAFAGGACIEACYAGGVCCPSHCGDGCCDPGASCADAARQFCCESGLSPCGGTSCCDPTDTCISATATCCPAGQNVCGISCCDPNYVCVGTACCLPSQVCGNVCCDEFGSCNNNVCCEALKQFCGGKCCGDICSSDGQCCPTGRYCGPSDGSGICCPPDHYCTDAATYSCSSGNQACQKGQVPCMSESANGYGPGLCCAPGASCCNGACCPDKNQICCTPVSGLGQTNGKFGCNLGAYCY